MPGRGNYWKKGGLNDGVVTQDDLDSAVSGGHTIEDEGSPLPEQSSLNFTGAGVTATDSGGKTVVDIPAGVGGGVARTDLADPFVDFWLYDEFFYPTPSTQFPHFETDVNSINAVNGEIGGVVQYSSTGVANNVARVNICGAGMQVVGTGKRVIMRCRVKINNFSATKGLMVGFFNSQSNGPGGTFPFTFKTISGLGFLLDGVGNVDTYSDDGITPETTDTGVAQDTAYHVYEVDFDPSGTPTITYKIDGVTVKTQTTNLPSFNGAWYCNGQTGDATGISVNLDSLFIYNTR